MELGIRLTPSRIHRSLNVLVLLGASGAIAISGLGFGWKLLLTVFVWGLSAFYSWREVPIQALVLKAFSSSQPDLDNIDGPEDSRVSGTITLQNGRYLEARLQSAWCLSWILIVGLKSHDKTRALAIFPDSCSQSERRQLRKLITTRTC